MEVTKEMIEAAQTELFRTGVDDLHDDEVKIILQAALNASTKS